MTAWMETNPRNSDAVQFFFLNRVPIAVSDNAMAVGNQDSFVLSLGGGTPCYSNNHEFLNADHVISIYLNASVDTLYERLIINSEQRPLIANKNPEEMKEFIAKNLFDRSYYYNQAQFKISVDGKSSEEIISEIETILA